MNLLRHRHEVQLLQNFAELVLVAQYATRSCLANASIETMKSAAIEDRGLPYIC